jgi:hypothetical protein
MIYVTDLKRKKQWRCKPSEVGHRRDFNRIDDPSVPDPLVIESHFAEIEDKLAPLLRRLTRDMRGPKDSWELGLLVEYLAIQWIRVPTFREVVRRAYDISFQEEALSSPEAWARALRNAGVSKGEPGTDYAQALEGIKSGQIEFSPPVEFYFKQGAALLPDAGPELMQRRWGWLISETGQFIGSDNPVSLDGPPNQPNGIVNAPWVSYPTTRHLLLYGTRQPIKLPPLTTKRIAMHNTFLMLTADEQVYSHRPDFHWLDSKDQCQNDWTLFSKDSFVARESV